MPEQIRWGILGAALIADKISRGIQEATDQKVTAIGSRSLERAREWAATRRIPKAVGSYEAVLDDPDIDAVYIPLPPSLHHPWTIRAIEAGKHVLCEKPLALDAGQAREMIDAATSRGVTLMDGTMWVHHDRTAAMRRVLASAELGEIRRVTTAFSFNWDTVPTENIRVKPELGGGSLGDLGWYCVRVILWTLGLPRRVWAFERQAHGVDMNFSALMEFPAGPIASFDCGFDTVMRQWVEIAGTKNSLVCDDFVLPTKETGSRFWIHHPDGKSDEKQTGFCRQEVNMVERFARAIRRDSADGVKTVTDEVTASLNTMIVLDALRESVRRGTWSEIAEGAG